MADDTIFWGEVHTHTALSDGNGSAEDNFAVARSHLDFWAMADHAYDPVVFSADYRKMRAGGQLLNDHWADVQELCRQNEQPGSFVPLLAYEWTNYQYGHHNVYYRDYDQPIRMPATLPELYDALRGVEAFVIPHHTGYAVGSCGKNWDYHDDALSPFVELYSLHGSSEEPDGIRPLLTRGSWMGPGAAGGSVQEGLARGYRLGIMASSDSHGDHPGAYDNGLIAVHAPELTRTALWEAMANRHIYGITGDRIALDFRLNGRPMGAIVRAEGARSLQVSAVAWDEIERLDVLKNNRIWRSSSEPCPATPWTAGRVRFLLEWGWDQKGPHDWTGRMELQGGRLRQAIPCYRGSMASRLGTGVDHLEGGLCTWTSRTEKPEAWGFSRRSADVLAVEADCRPDARFDLTMATGRYRRRLSLSARDVLARSHLAYMEDVPPTNDGSHWRSMETYLKLKVHRGHPIERLSVDLSLEDPADDSPAGGTDFYYVRLIQRNGQRAWSSPIWVKG
ncbi:MAG: DUF3604 domain-containing protein [Candidatus Brocadiaceae bacterium]|nr:DUF3604 domain-containing protein [Candidatus Brocadiaceae bacterium]